MDDLKEKSWYAILKMETEDGNQWKDKFSAIILMIIIINLWLKLHLNLVKHLSKCDN